MSSLNSPSLQSIDSSDISLTVSSITATWNATPTDTGPRHSQFYFDDTMLTMVADGLLYRVHATPFIRHSEFWAKKIAGEDGSTIHHLENISSTELEAFMSILYPTSFSRSNSLSMRTVGTWAAVLRLSKMWDFVDVHTLAVEQLTKLASPIDKLVLSHKYDIAEWLIPSYVALCSREELPSSFEAEKLIPEDLRVIAQAREDLIYGRVDTTSEAVTTRVTELVQLISTAHAGDRPSAFIRSEQSGSSQRTTASSNISLLESLSNEDRTRLSALISEGKYKEAVSNATSRHIPFFCSSLRKQWEAQLAEADIRDLIRAILSRAATDPAFTQIGIELIRAVSTLVRTGSFKSDNPACRSVEAFLNRDIRGIVETWSTCNEVRLRHRAQHKDWAHWYACEDTFGEVSMVVLGDDDIKRSIELYMTKSSYLKDFFHSLIDADVVNAAVLQL